MSRCPNIWLATMVLLLLGVAGAACLQQSPITDETNIPVHVSRDVNGSVDTDALYRTVVPLLQQKLPGAYFSGAVFFTSCDLIHRLDGRIVFILERVQFGIPRRRVERISATVHTEQQFMDTWYKDDSDHYPAVKKLVFPGDGAIKQTLGIAQDHLDTLGVTVCTLTITQVDDTVWHVVCSDLGSTRRPCYFNIEDGQVKPESVR